MSLKFARDLPAKPFNTALPRFDPKFWTVDFNKEMLATITPLSGDTFKVSAQFRSNADFIGVKWTSEDHFDHDYFKYATDNDYTNTILAFRHNPTNPNQFTATISDSSFAWTYRLVPYALVGGRYVPLDPLFNTKRTYPASVIKPPAEWTDIPGGLVPYHGRTDYIFILDFDDLRILHFYSGRQIDARAVLEVSFDTLIGSHGLGELTNVESIVQVSHNVVRLTMSNVRIGAKLVPGDKLQVVYRTSLRLAGPHQEEYEVISSSGFGSGTLTAICKGNVLGGAFLVADAFYGRFLKSICPVALQDYEFYFADLKCSGNRTEILKRNHPQPAHSLMMTSGFDDSYSTSADRQVEMVHALGYRGFWNTYVGMSHYFNARTVWLDSETGTHIPVGNDTAHQILFAGSVGAAAHFTIGDLPNRGIDQFKADLGTHYGIPGGLFSVINGAVANSVVDRACSPDPSDAEGWYWWDLEAGAPGPALEYCVLKAAKSDLTAILWSAGELDAAALEQPGGRVPAPSYTRHEACLRAIFAYMREQWGDLPIIIQDVAWGWTAARLTAPSGQPIYLDASANSWGDIVFTWLSLRFSPVGRTYTVEILPPVGETPVRTIIVPGTQIDGGVIYADYPVEQNVLDWGFPPNFIRWRVRDDVGNVSEDWANFPQIDNAAIVKRTVLFGGQSNAFGHFSQLSGATKADYSAGTFRRHLADLLGLRHVQVMPVNASLGSSAIDRQADDDPVHGANYWWDLGDATYNVDVPGPRTTALIDIVNALGVPVDDLIWSQGENDVGAMDPIAMPRYSTVQRFKDATLRVFAAISSACSNADLPIWIQTIGRGWWGDTPPPEPSEVAGVYYKAARDVQKDLAANSQQIRIGSWPDGLARSQNYIKEVGNPGWIHYKSAVYHAAATELAESIFNNVDLVTSAPAWTSLSPPRNIRVTKNSGSGDMTIAWDDPSGYGRSYGNDYGTLNDTDWRVTSLHLGTGAVAHVWDTSTRSQVYTLAEQTADYGFGAGYWSGSVQSYDPVNDILGPAANFAGAADSTGGPAPTGLTATKSGFDVIFGWSGTPGATWRVRNYNVGTGVMFSETVVTSMTYNFTAAMQGAEYGFGVGFVHYKVAEYEGGDWGAEADFNGAVT